VPRKFVELFCDVAREFDFSVKKKWDRPTAMSVLARNAVVNRGNFYRNDSPVASAFNRAREIAREMRSRVFLVKRVERQEIGVAISDLFHHELIHFIDDASLPISLADEFDAYYLDYGYFLSETTRIKDLEAVTLKCPLTDNMSRDSLDKLTVFARNIGGEVLTCRACGERVSKKNPLVSIRNICPNCYMDLE
jgi:hypothetical protein